MQGMHKTTIKYSLLLSRSAAVEITPPTDTDKDTDEYKNARTVTDTHNDTDTDTGTEIYLDLRTRDVSNRQLHLIMFVGMP